MKLPPAIEKTAARFDAMTVRERMLVLAAALTATGMLWTLAVLDPINARQRALNDEKISLEAALGGTLDAAPDATGLALEREKKLQATLDDYDAKLTSTSHGLVPPERMVQVIHDVLDRQRGVRLLSMRNLPLTSLIQPAPPTAAAADQMDVQADAPVETGPYMHPVEIVLEGRYLDVLAYLRALEALPWRFYWKVLELHSDNYPSNVVRIELGTLSMDEEWLGV